MTRTPTAIDVVARTQDTGFALDRRLVALDLAMWRRRCPDDGGTVAHHVLAVLHAAEHGCSALRGAPHRHGETPVRLRPALVLRRWRRAHRCVVQHLIDRRASPVPGLVEAAVDDYLASVGHCLDLLSGIEDP